MITIDNLKTDSLLARLISVARWGLVCVESHDLAKRHGVIVEFRGDGMSPDDALFLLGNRLRILYTNAHTTPHLLEEAVKGEHGFNHEAFTMLLDAGNLVSVETELMFGGHANRERAMEALRDWSHNLRLTSVALLNDVKVEDGFVMSKLDTLIKTHDAFSEAENDVISLLEERRDALRGLVLFLSFATNSFSAEFRFIYSDVKYTNVVVPRELPSDVRSELTDEQADEVCLLLVTQPIQDDDIDVDDEPVTGYDAPVLKRWLDETSTVEDLQTYVKERIHVNHREASEANLEGLKRLYSSAVQNLKWVKNLDAIEFHGEERKQQTVNAVERNANRLMERLITAQAEKSVAVESTDAWFETLKADNPRLVSEYLK